MAIKNDTGPHLVKKFGPFLANYVKKLTQTAISINQQTHNLHALKRYTDQDRKRDCDRTNIEDWQKRMGKLVKFESEKFEAVNKTLVKVILGKALNSGKPQENLKQKFCSNECVANYALAMRAFHKSGTMLSGILRSKLEFLTQRFVQYRFNKQSGVDMRANVKTVLFVRNPIRLLVSSYYYHCVRGVESYFGGQSLSELPPQIRGGLGFTAVQLQARKSGFPAWDPDETYQGYMLRKNHTGDVFTKAQRMLMEMRRNLVHDMGDMELNLEFARNFPKSVLPLCLESLSGPSRENQIKKMLDFLEINSTHIDLFSKPSSDTNENSAAVKHGTQNLQQKDDFQLVRALDAGHFGGLFARLEEKFGCPF